MVRLAPFLLIVACAPVDDSTIAKRHADEIMKTLAARHLLLLTPQLDKDDIKREIKEHIESAIRESHQ